MKIKKAIALSMAIMVALGALTGCNSSKGESEKKKNSANIINIGITDSLSSVNPLLMDATETLKYTMGMQFLPLMELNKNLEFEGMLASSITTEDNIHFTVKIEKEATWSDGTPITADDVVFTVLKLGSKTLANANMLLYAFEGFGDDGFLLDGATSAEGVKAIDEKTVQFTTKYKMALTTFQNSYGRYILTLPKHILEQVPEDKLASYDWFSKPTVVSGPYKMTSYDLQHFVSYEANDKFWKGAPKINKLNFKIVTPPQLYTSLQSGEIDLIQQTTGSILLEDYKNIEALENITSNYGVPVTSQSIFFNTTTITDKNIRQAILYGINREEILSGMINGKGEVVDGFLSTASPFFDKDLKVTSYDPKKAKELVKEAEKNGWDSSKVLTFNINSGDTTFVQAADYIVVQLKEIGINAKVNMIDLSTLLAKAGTKDFDIMAIQYTYAPVDPYPDIKWLLSEDGWTGYSNEAINVALEETQATSDNAEIKKSYSKINTVVQEDVPMISTYVFSALGAVNKRVKNATPDVYGTFINVQQWEVTP